MRILHVSSLYPPAVTGGAEKVVEMLAEAQARQGLEVAAAYLTRDPAPDGVRNGVTVFPLQSRNLVWMGEVNSRPRAVRMANKLAQAVNPAPGADFAAVMRRWRPDVVHTHSMVELPPMIWRAARQAGAAVVHTLHDYDLLCARASLFKHGQACARRHPSCLLLSRWKSLFERDIDAVAAVSRPVLDLHLEHGFFRRLPPERRRVVWNGAPVAEGRARRPRTGPIVFGFLGRLVAEKGLGVLIEACRRLPPAGWRLKIAGRALPGAERFEDQAAGLPIDFLGFTDPAAFLADIDVLVVPSVWAEPFGLTVIEAYAAGAPVIGAASGAIGELVGRVDPDWVVPANDPAALAARMARVMAEGRAALPDPVTFAPVLEAARPERMTADYLDLYRGLLPQPLARRAAPRTASREPAHAHPAP